MIKDLGQVAAIYIGTTEPINYTLLWLDTNTNPGVYKAYDSNLKRWVPLATQSWVQDLIDNWIQNWPVSDDIVEGDYILINKGGENYKIEAQDIIQNLIGKPLNFQNIVSNGSQLPASASDLKNGDLYILNVPGDIDTQVVTQPTQQVFLNRSILFWDEGEWKSMGRVEWKCDLSMVQTSDTVTINSSLGTGITIPTATDSQAGVLSAILFIYLTKLSNGTVIPRTPNGSTQTPGHIHNYTDIEGRIVVIDTVGDINKDLDTSNPPSQRAVTEALYTKYDKTGGEISGIVRITDGTEATQLGEGALIVNGGLSIFKNVYFGENLDVVGATHLHSTLDVDGITHILNTTNSTANNNGALVVDGGVGIAKNVNIGGVVDVDGNSSLHGTLTVDGATTLNSTLHTVGAVTFDNTLDVAGISNFNNTTESTAYTNGAVVVDGGVGIAKRLNVHGATDIDSTLNVDGATTLNNTLHGVGAVTFDSTLTVAGITHITNRTNSSGLGMGALVVDGGVSVGGMMNVSGDAFLRDDLTVTNDTYLRGNLVVSGATAVQDITIHGNVTQEGQSFITEAETVEIKDNILLINKGEVGAGVTAGLAGIEVDRGTSPNFQFVFDESDDYFKAGEIGDLQILLLRDADANLTNNKFFYWDNTNKIAKTREVKVADLSDLNSTWDTFMTGSTLATRNILINGNAWTFYSTIGTDTTRIYAPTTMSTNSNQVLTGSSDGIPKWGYPKLIRSYTGDRISSLAIGRNSELGTSMYTRFDIFSANASSIPGTDSISGDQINDGAVQTYFWDNTTFAVQLALDIDGTGVAYRSYNPVDGTVREGWKFLASTSWVNSHVNEELKAYLPLTAGSSKPLTGPLFIRNSVHIGQDGVDEYHSIYVHRADTTVEFTNDSISAVINVSNGSSTGKFQIGLSSLLYNNVAVATQTWTNTQLAKYLPLSGGTMTSTIRLAPGDSGGLGFNSSEVSGKTFFWYEENGRGCIVGNSSRQLTLHTSTNSNLYHQVAGGTRYKIYDESNLFPRTISFNNVNYDVKTTLATSQQQPFKFYAPTTAGTSGQILQSTGGAPTWTNDNFFRQSRGAIESTDLDTFVSRTSGTYSVDLEGSSAILAVLARQMGSTSALEFYSNYTMSDFRVRTTIDNNKYNPWKYFVLSNSGTENIANYVKLNGDSFKPNNMCWGGTRTDGTTTCLVFINPENIALFGHTSLPLRLRSSSNPTVLVGTSTYTLLHTGNIGSITFTGAVSATYNGTNDITVNIPQGGGGGTADISISNGPAVSGQYVSGMSESGGVITLTRAALPTLSGGASATSGQYVSGVTVSGHTVTVTKANLPTVTLSSLGITATAAEINKLDGLTATTTELNYVDGVTSNIQTQLNNKAASTHTHPVAQINNLGTNWSARLTAAINVKSVNINGTTTSYLNTTNATAVTIYAPTSAGTNGYLLVSNGSGAPSWASVSSVVGTGFVTLDTTQTITGAKTFTAYTIFSNGAGTATSSDKRLKENIKEITYNKGFDEISLYSYNFKGRKEEKIGLIAQEVQKVIPQAVIKDEKGYLAIDTYPIVATLVAANGERVREVKNLKSEIDNLKQEIEILKQEISILKRIVRL